MIMNFETLEQFRYEYTQATMKAMMDIAADPKATPEMRIKAAKVVDAMSDSIIKAWLMSEVNNKSEKQTNKLTKQLDRLIDEKDSED